MNKFSDIIYPFFGIKLKPWNVFFDLTKIQIQKTYTGHYETVDDKTLKVIILQDLLKWIKD